MKYNILISLKDYLKENSVSTPVFGIIYKATNCNNGKIYIGQTVQPLHQRISKHYNKAQKSNIHFANALKSNLKSDFIWEVIDIAYSEEEIDEKEQEHIWINNSTDRNLGYNYSFGGRSHTVIDFDKVVKLFQFGENVDLISKKLGYERTNLLSRLKSYFGEEEYRDLQKKSKNSYKLLQVDVDKNLLKELCEKGYSFNYIAKKLNCGKTVIRSRIKKFFGMDFYNKLAIRNYNNRFKLCEE